MIERSVDRIRERQIGTNRETHTERDREEDKE